ncbi:MAG TPA: Ig-like domain-containing protein [Kofleriaceae bacterium]|nr:Ig-like domain-containing protein [Kofleriaceae bacterium]
MCAIDARIDSPRPIDAPPPDADITPPQIFMTDPVSGASNVPTSQVVTIQFNEPVSGVSNTTFRLESSSVSIPGTVMGIDPFKYAFMPASALPANATITVYVDAGIFDVPANNAFVPTSFDFMTAP